MAVIYANADDFKEKTAEGTIILDFYADWCAPCRMLGPVLEQIADENDDIKVVKVNVDENQALAGEFGVRGIPALFVLKDGKQVANRAGFMPKDGLVDWYETHKKIPSLKLGFFMLISYNQCGDNMDGILLVNKPKGFSSHDVVAVLRGILKTKKIGHTGTLDPDATGLLVLGINTGTKIMKYLNNDEKEYIAKACIGRSTDTLDKTGETLEEVNVLTLDNVTEIVHSFKGLYTQTPPMYSAIKYKGKRLYEYARKGITIPDIPSRDIMIYDIEQLNDVTYEDNVAFIDYRVHASKGLYVRTLSYDIGKKLGYPAHNYELHRTKAGSFDIKDSYTLEDIKAGNYTLISLPEALSNMETLVLPEELRHHVKNGMAISLRYFKKAALTKIVDQNNTLLAIYDKHPTESKMKAENIFYKE